MAHEVFVTAINCMDGRTQLPVNEWLRHEFKADYVDTITEPGPDRILSEQANPLADSIKSRVLISVEKHGSKVIAVVAHGGCAGNPVAKDEHLRMIKQAAYVVAKWDLGVTVVGLWLDQPDWIVQKVC